MHHPLQPNPLDADTLLLRFLSGQVPSEDEKVLDLLLSEHAEPLIRSVIQRKFALGGIQPALNELQDIDDLCQDVLYHLILRLKELKESKSASGIRDFRSYVAGCAQNGYNAYLRRKYAARWSFKSRLRYLLSHRLRFGLWEDEHHELACGYAEWQSDDRRSKYLEPGQLNRFVETVVGARLEQDPEEFLIELFGKVGKPVLLDELVRSLTAIAGVEGTLEAEAVSPDGAPIFDLLPSHSPNMVTRLELRCYLEGLWKEVCGLPPRQRVALLLNLRDAKGNDALMLFKVTGVANMRKIAETLELKPETFVRLWNRLPLDDQSIAQYIGLTRQQVINLRKSARERLARRMAVRFESKQRSDGK